MQNRRVGAYKKSLIFYAFNVIIQANLLACNGKFAPYSQDITHFAKAKKARRRIISSAEIGVA